MKVLFLTMYILKAIWLLLFIFQFITFFLSREVLVKASIPREDYGYETSFVRSSDPNHQSGSVHTWMEHKQGDKIMVYNIGKQDYVFSDYLTNVCMVFFFFYVFVTFYAIPAAFKDARESSSQSSSK